MGWADTMMLKKAHGRAQQKLGLDSSEPSPHGPSVGQQREEALSSVSELWPSSISETEMGTQRKLTR